MDTVILKRMAGHVRALLERSDRSIGHSQSLDLIAALPGLRNWPEVGAFPDRVTATDFDLASTGRLSFRLKKRFGLDVPAKDLMVMLAPDAAKPVFVPQIWPSGPKPGVYVTTSQNAINALLEQYEEATDGALVYAERAGSHWNGSIDLGDNGLWSSGLDRVPSGTLIVVGPLDLDQQDRKGTAERFEMACLHAINTGHRIAVLVNTPQPASLRQDVQMLVTTLPEYTDEDFALAGIVSEQGDLETVSPFAGGWPAIQTVQSSATLDALPQEAVELLRSALSTRKNGIVLFGTSIISDHAAINLVAASLALTEHVGPAARIMPRHRSTPSKDWNVPEAIRELPFLPSIESAFAQGYRRLIYHPTYTNPEQLQAYSDDAMLISGTFGSDVTSVFASASRYGGLLDDSELLRRIVSILAVTPIQEKATIMDFWISNGHIPQKIKNYEEVEELLTSSRAIRWQDQLPRLLDEGVVTPDSMNDALLRHDAMRAFLNDYVRDKTGVEAD